MYRILRDFRGSVLVQQQTLSDPDETIDDGYNTVINPSGTNQGAFLVRVGNADRNDLWMGDFVVVVRDGDYCHGAALDQQTY